MNRFLIPVLRACLFIVFPLVTGSFPAHDSAAQEPPLMLFFYRETCDECRQVRTEFLPGFLDRWGDRIQFVQLELSQPGYLDSLYAMESRTRFPESEKHYPAIYFMGTLTEGPEAIAFDEDRIVRQYFTNPDSARAVDREVLARVPEKYDSTAVALARTVHIAYFYELDCAECTRSFEITQWIENLYSSVEIDTLSMSVAKNRAIAAALAARAGIPRSEVKSPLIVVGNDCLVSSRITRADLVQLFNKYKDTGAEATWEQLTDADLAQYGIADRNSPALMGMIVIPVLLILFLLGGFVLWKMNR